MFNLVLFQPEIPPNTGNIIRLCANTGAQLHLIGPLGFTLDDKRLRRAGLDYHETAGIQYYADWQTFREQQQTARLIGLSTKGTQRYSDFQFQADDFLLFGPETRGLPAEILQQLGPEFVLRLPMLASSRSLNLSNTVAIVLYEALRQRSFPGCL